MVIFVFFVIFVWLSSFVMSSVVLNYVGRFCKAKLTSNEASL